MKENFKEKTTMNENEMKMIEEMAKTISNCSMGDCVFCNGRHKCIYYKSAESLYNANCRIIGEDEIVIKTDIKCVDSTTAVNGIDFFAKHNAKVRQETAREVTNKIYNKLTESDVWHDMKKIWWRHNNECYELKGVLKQVLKELGIELEEEK